MNLSYWTCCGRNYAAGVSRCKVCGEGRKVASTDGDRIIVKREDKDYENKQARIKRKIKPGDDDQLFTSTLNRRDEK